METNIFGLDMINYEYPAPHISIEREIFENDLEWLGNYTGSAYLRASSDWIVASCHPWWRFCGQPSSSSSRSPSHRSGHWPGAA